MTADAFPILDPTPAQLLSLAESLATVSPSLAAGLVAVACGAEWEAS